MMPVPGGFWRYTGRLEITTTPANNEPITSNCPTILIGLIIEVRSDFRPDLVRQRSQGIFLAVARSLPSAEEAPQFWRRIDRVPRENVRTQGSTSILWVRDRAAPACGDRGHDVARSVALSRRYRAD